MLTNTTQVGEEDYQQLKSEQCLRVDFSSFPSYLIQLLQRCKTIFFDYVCMFITCS